MPARRRRDRRGVWGRLWWRGLAVVAIAGALGRAPAAASIGGADDDSAAGGGPAVVVADCLARAEAEIARVPDKQEVFVTTSRAFKRDLAAFFCARSPEQLRALELGVYHGHTTAMLAAIFGQVLALDVEEEYLRSSAAAERRNVVFLTFDSYSSDWRLLGASRVDVAIIDADHRYEKVRSDAIGLLSHVPHLQYVVFDDFGVESDVRRVVDELLAARALQDCRPIGEGVDGRAWYLRTFDWVNHSEGVLCARGPGSASDARAVYTDVTFLVYAVPADTLVRAEGVMSFVGDGRVFTQQWGYGQWRAAVGAEPRDVLHMRVPNLPPESMGVWEVLFNKGRTAFVLTPEGSTATKWFGMRADKVNQVLRIASEQFD